MNLNYIGVLTILTYLSAALAQGLYLFGFISSSRWRYLTCAALCIAAHGWILYKFIETPQGQNLNWLIMLSFTLWIMNIISLLTSRQSKSENLSILNYPLSAFSIILMLSFAGSDVIETKNQLGVLAHIFISMLAMSFLILASLQAILMGLQNYLLKHHHPSPMLRILPPLQSMESLLFTIIWLGMIFLSGSLLSGFYFQVGLFTPFLLPKTLLAVSAWILLTALLIGHRLFGWRGPTAIRWTISGSCLAFLSYFGTKALLL
ncbi:MAG: inner membrane protein YpjD [Candidatus Berkiellales bacterium]